MKTIKLTLLILLISIFNYNVNAQDSISKQSNKNETNLPTFTGIDAGDASTIFISQGDVQSVKAEEDGVEFTVKDGILRIAPKTKSGNETSDIYIVCPNLKMIKAGGITKVKSINEIKSDGIDIKTTGASQVSLSLNISGNITVNMSGASNITLKGSTNTLIANLSGAANLLAVKLNAVNGNINATGVSRAKVNVNDRLEVNESGMGKVTNEKKSLKEVNSNKTHGKYIEKEIEITDDSVGKGKIDSVRITKIITYSDNKSDGNNYKENNGEDVLDIDENNLSMSVNPKKTKFHGHWAGFGLGFNGYVDKNFSNTLAAKYDFLKLNMNKSVEVDINFFNVSANIINNRLGVVTGLGLQYNNYRFDYDVVLCPDSSQIYGYHNKAIDSYIKSKLTMSWLRVPLFIEYQTSKVNHKQQFHISAGAVFGYRIGSHSKQVYIKDGEKQKDKIYNDFYLNPIKLDAEVRVGWGPINLFASYALTTLFQDGKGPELYPYTVGITLIGW